MTLSREIDQGTELGEVLLHSLMRDQRRLGGIVLVALAVVFAPLPLVLHLAPSLGSLAVAGVPVVWVCLGVLPFPFLWLLGRWYVRRAEANERAFSDLLAEFES